MVAYRYQREFTYDQLIVNTFRQCFLSFKKNLMFKSGVTVWNVSCYLLDINFVESWSDKSTYLFPFRLSVSLILPTTSCIVYQALHCCSVTHSIVNRTLHCLAMQRNAIIWEFCAVTFAYVQAYIAEMGYDVMSILEVGWSLDMLTVTWFWYQNESRWQWYCTFIVILLLLVPVTNMHNQLQGYNISGAISVWAEWRSA